MKPLLVWSTKTVSFILFFLLGCYSSQAQTYPSTDTAIHYLGVHDGMVVFEINGDALPARSLIRITDGERNILLEERIVSGTLRKRYKLLPEEVQRVQFEIFHKSVVVIKRTFDLKRYTEERIVVTAER